MALALLSVLTILAAEIEGQEIEEVVLRWQSWWPVRILKRESYGIQWSKWGQSEGRTAKSKPGIGYEQHEQTVSPTEIHQESGQDI